MKIRLQILEIIYGTLLVLSLAILIADYFFIDEFKMESTYVLFALPLLCIGILLTFWKRLKIVFLVTIVFVNMLTFLNGGVLFLHLGLYAFLGAAIPMIWVFAAIVNLVLLITSVWLFARTVKMLASK